MFYQFDHFLVDNEHCKLLAAGDSVSDDQKTIKLLTLLCENYPEVVDKQTLIEQLWPDQVVTDWSLSKLVSDVRQLLGDSGKDQGYIRTVRGRGFRFNSEVKKLTEKPNYKNSAKRYLTNRSFEFLRLVFVIILAITGYYFIMNQGEIETHHSDPIRVAVLPIMNEGLQEPVNEWIKYGIMALATEQLSSYQSIQTLPIATVINLAAEVDHENTDGRLFEQICGQIGCSHLVAIKYKYGAKSNPVLTYQILKRDYRSPISDFSQTDIIDTADMLLDYLASDLIPAEKEHLSLADTYSNDNKANRDYAIGVDELLTGDFKSARGYLKMALGRKHNFLWASIYLAEVDYRTGRLSESIEIITQLKKRTLNDSQSYFLQHLYSNILYSQGKLEESIQASIELQKNPLTLEDPILMGNELMNIGSSMQSLGKMEQAIHYLEKSQLAYQKAKYGSGQGKAFYNIANVYRTTARKPEAITYYQKAREVFVRFKMQGYVLMAKQQIATTNLSLGKIQHAEGELRLVIAGYRQMGDMEGELMASSDLIDVSFAKQDFIEAKQRAQKLLTKLELTEFSYLTHHTHALLVRVNLRLGELASAEEHYRQLSGEWNDIRPEFVFMQAFIHYQHGRFKQALENAFQIKKQLGSRWTIPHQDILVLLEQSLEQNKMLSTLY